MSAKQIPDILRPGLWRPDVVVGELCRTDPEWLVAQFPDSEAFLYDVDGTGLDYNDEHYSSEMLDFFLAISRHRQQAHLSNAGAKRTPRVARLSQEVGNYIGREFPFITSDMTGSGKPSKAAFDAAIERFGFDPTNTVHVGDLAWKDILGAKRAGLGGTVLAAHYGNGDDWRVKYLERPIQEAVLLPLLGIRRPEPQNRLSPVFDC